MTSDQPVRISDIHKGALRTYLLDIDEWEQRHAAELAKEGDDLGYSALVWFTLETALRRRFSPTCSFADVIRYVADLRILLAEDAGLLNPGLTEKIIRSLLGDASLNGRPAFGEAPEDVFAAGLLLLVTLVTEANLDETGVKQLLDEAAASAERRAREDVAYTEQWPAARLSEQAERR